MKFPVQNHFPLQTYLIKVVIKSNCIHNMLFQQYIIYLKKVSRQLYKELNGLVFTYGVTNSGKTYTVIGNQDTPGILPLTFQTLDKIRTAFKMNKPYVQIGDTTINLRDQFLDEEYTYKLDDIAFSFSSLEIYNEEIYDLLASQKTKLQLKEVSDRKWFVKDASEQKIITDQICRMYLNRALQNRAMGETTLNSQSSRSHTIFKIYVELTYKAADKYQITKRHNICIVDLAGSERAKKAETQGSQLTEACNINKSLLVLGKCLKIMQSESDQRIPFRECKLTRLLSEYFTEDNKILMVVNVKLTKNDIDETLKVLHYGALSVNVNLIKSRIYDSTASFTQRIQIVQNEGQIQENKPKKNQFEAVRRAKMLIQQQVNCMRFQQEIQQQQSDQLIERIKGFQSQLKSIEQQKEAGYFSSFHSEQKLQKSLEKILSQKSKQNSLQGDNCEDVLPFNTFQEESQGQNQEFIGQLKKKFSFKHEHEISEEQVDNIVNNQEKQEKLQQIKEEESKENSKCDQFENQKPTSIFDQIEIQGFNKQELLQEEKQQEYDQFQRSPSSELLLDPQELQKQIENDCLSKEKEKKHFDQATNTTPFDEMKQKLFSRVFLEDMQKLQEEKDEYKKQILSKLINEEDVQEIIDKENQIQQSNLEQSAKKLQQRNLEKLATSNHKSALKIIDESDQEYKKSHGGENLQKKPHKAPQKKKQQHHQQNQKLKNKKKKH